MSTTDSSPRWRRFKRQLIKSPAGVVALVIMLLFITTTIIGPVVWKADPLKMQITQRLKPPSKQNPLGTDEFGRDLLARLIAGTRITLQLVLVSFEARSSACALGST
jgi:peptide/nickel transport system permease protein